MGYDKSTKDGVNVVHCSPQSERKPPPGVPAPKGGLLYLGLTAREPSVKPLATATTAASGGNREKLLGPRPAGCERQRSRLRGCTKTEPSLCRKVRLVTLLPVSFCRSLWYTESAVYPRYPYGKGGDIMAYLLTFLVSVAANLASDIMSRFNCKWLARYDDDRKPH